jgi:hypothetical protein
MIMKTLLRRRRIIISGLLPLLCAMLVAAPAWAALRHDGSSARSTAVKWNLKDNMIVINYDLPTDPDAKYVVGVVMKQESDPSFAAVPVAVEGDVGEGYFAGTNREIRWHFRKDYPQGLVGDDYFFEIQIQAQDKPSTSGWIYAALGVAAVTGGVLAFVISKNQSELGSPTGK